MQQGKNDGTTGRGGEGFGFFAFRDCKEINCPF